MLDVAQLGQVFTPDSVVDMMLSLCQNHGRTLEPSAGNGAFSSKLPGCVAIEIDERVAPPGALVMDFFDYPVTERFSSVIGNPPYVAFKDIRESTRGKLTSPLFDSRSNLFLHFVEKAVRHLLPGGEAILIVPRELAKLTAARKLNEFLAAEGSITHYIETGDARIFRGAMPNCVIFRFEKGRNDRRMADGRIFQCINGQLMFLRRDYGGSLADLFEVRVGAVSGADPIFSHPEGNMDFVCSKTIDTGETRRMIYGVKHPHLLQHKAKLLSRRIRDFTEENWWHWGRDHHINDSPRIYVNGKTRRKSPFFLHECKNYDGSIMALFPRDPAINVEEAVELLNSVVDWEELGFVCDGRFLFTQRSLQTCPIPTELIEALLPSGKTSKPRPICWPDLKLPPISLRVLPSAAWFYRERPAASPAHRQVPARTLDQSAHLRISQLLARRQR